MERKAFSVPKISCGHCVMTIRKELGALAGVRSVEDLYAVLAFFEALNQGKSKGAAALVRPHRALSPEPRESFDPIGINLRSRVQKSLVFTAGSSPYLHRENRALTAPPPIEAIIELPPDSPYAVPLSAHSLDFSVKHTIELLPIDPPEETATDTFPTDSPFNSNITLLPINPPEKTTLDILPINPSCKTTIDLLPTVLPTEAPIPTLPINPPTYTLPIDPPITPLPINPFLIKNTVNPLPIEIPANPLPIEGLARLIAAIKRPTTRRLRSSLTSIASMARRKRQAGRKRTAVAVLGGRLAGLVRRALFSGLAAMVSRTQPRALSTSSGVSGGWAFSTLSAVGVDGGVKVGTGVKVNRGLKIGIDKRVEKVMVLEREMKVETRADTGVRIGIESGLGLGMGLAFGGWSSRGGSGFGGVVSPPLSPQGLSSICPTGGPPQQILQISGRTQSLEQICVILCVKVARNLKKTRRVFLDSLSKISLEAIQTRRFRARVLAMRWKAAAKFLRGLAKNGPFLRLFFNKFEQKLRTALKKLRSRNSTPLASTTPSYSLLPSFYSAPHISFASPAYRVAEPSSVRVLPQSPQNVLKTSQLDFLFASIEGEYSARVASARPRDAQRPRKSPNPL